MIKTGIGYDIHKLARGKKLFVGGVEVKSDFGSIGHSDGDALIHAIVILFRSINSRRHWSVFPK